MIHLEVQETLLFEISFSFQLYKQITIWHSHQFELPEKSCGIVGDQNNSTGETGNRSLPNNTSARSVERTITQKLSIPILEKNDHTSAKLWWRKFTQYIKMTREIDLSKMANSKEVLPQNRDQLEKKEKTSSFGHLGNQHSRRWQRR